MNQSLKITSSNVIGRVRSVDFFRGLTMFLLIGEGTHLYQHIKSIEGSRITGFLGEQLSHQHWQGMHFWDLIQPFFMFIVGVAIPFSVTNRLRKGEEYSHILRHAFKRSFILLFLGWALYCIGPGKIVFRFQNVLAQLSVTYIVAFLIVRKSFTFQLIFSLTILLFIDLAYRYFPIEGYNNAWVNGENLGAWFNHLLEGGKGGGWASLNAISTTAHTIWGVLCGQLILSNRVVKQKLQLMIIAGISGLLVGYSLDFLEITPIIKKIATSSFVFASGGWSILALCFSYWLIDVKKLFLKGSEFFVIVGMNPIFIYLFVELGGANLISKIFVPFVKALFFWSGDLFVQIIISLCVWAALWYICYWLYKKRIFIKI